VTVKRDEAYQKFRNAIFNRTFKPGQFLTQAEIIKELGISLGPLRDAAKRLEWEELILLIPQRGLQIALPNINTQNIIQPVMEEHLDVIEAVKFGNPELAAQAMEKRLNQSLRSIMGV